MNDAIGVFADNAVVLMVHVVYFENFVRGVISQKRIFMTFQGKVYLVWEVVQSTLLTAGPKSWQDDPVWTQLTPAGNRQVLSKPALPQERKLLITHCLKIWV